MIELVAAAEEKGRRLVHGIATSATIALRNVAMEHVASLWLCSEASIGCLHLITIESAKTMIMAD